MKTVVGSSLVALLVFAAHGVSLAGPAELEEIRRGCLAQIGARCDCIVQSASALGNKEQAYVAALMAQDATRLQALIPTMSQAEIAVANGFFQSSAVACSGRAG
jgi:hypothetical protein